MGKNQNRKAQKVAAAKRTRTKVRNITIAVSLGILALVLIIAVPRAIRQSQVWLLARTEAQTASMLIDRLHDSQPGLVLRDDSSENLDLVLGPASLDVTAAQLVAFDPLVLYVTDQSLSRYGEPYNSILQQVIEQWNRSKTDGGYALGLMGNDDRDFALVMLFLLRQLTTEADFNSALELMATETPSESELDRATELFESAIVFLNQWVERGIIPATWTNWDSIALREGLSTGTIQQAIALRSLKKSMEFEEAFPLNLYPLPVGTGITRSTAFGVGLALEPGSGPRSGSLPDALAALRDPDFQLLLEEESLWTSLDSDTILNREHRDAMGVLKRAQGVTTVPENIEGNPVVDRLRFELRR